MITFKKAVFLFFIVLLFVSLAANIYLVFQLRQSIKLVEAQKINLKILAFRNMFTQKVLLADGEVDFDTRLTLENAVRALNDQEIFDQWEKFTNSQTKENATDHAKKLLDLLIQKTSR